METRAYLEGLGLELELDPHTKTKSTLEFFAGELADKQPGEVATEQAEQPAPTPGAD
jgi:hypothetical protein